MQPSHSAIALNAGASDLKRRVGTTMSPTHFSLGRPMPSACDPCEHFDPLKTIRHKHMFRAKPKPPCLRQLSGPNGRQFIGGILYVHQCVRKSEKEKRFQMLWRHYENP